MDCIKSYENLTAARATQEELACIRLSALKQLTKTSYQKLRHLRAASAM